MAAVKPEPVERARISLGRCGRLQPALIGSHGGIGRTRDIWGIGRTRDICARTRRRSERPFITGPKGGRYRNSELIIPARLLSESFRINYTSAVVVRIPPVIHGDIAKHCSFSGGCILSRPNSGHRRKRKARNLVASTIPPTKIPLFPVLVYQKGASGPCIRYRCLDTIQSGCRRARKKISQCFLNVLRCKTPVDASQVYSIYPRYKSAMGLVVLFATPWHLAT